MTRLGKKQLDLLAMMAGVGRCLVVPSKVSASLCRRGLMEPTGTSPKTSDSMIVVTPAGLRALADAIDAGLLSHRPDWEAIRKQRKGAEG